MSRSARRTRPLPYPAGNRPLTLPMRVWDLPIRLFHWIVALLICVSWLCAEMGWMKIHRISGYTILTALVFRLAWGVVGSDTARFASFLRSPLDGLRHLRRMRIREPDTEVGHNAAGGWMVLLMLAVMCVQVGTGLFANTFDDFDVNGPFARLVSRATSDLLSEIHSFNFNVLLALIALHILAVLAYAILKGQDLVRPMITGKKRLPGTARAPRMRSSLLAAIIFGTAGAIVALIVTQI